MADIGGAGPRQDAAVPAEGRPGSVPAAIRPARPEDEAAIVQLWRDCDLVASHNDPGRDFRLARAGSNSEVLVGQDGEGQDGEGRIIASVMVGDDGHRGWLYYVACAPDRRGSGIGRRMVAAAEAWLEQRGVAKLQLMIRETNMAVVPFYERLGFEVMPRVLMTKWLPGRGEDPA